MSQLSPQAELHSPELKSQVSLNFDLIFYLYFNLGTGLAAAVCYPLHTAAA
jgi:hypothetical protein